VNTGFDLVLVSSGVIELNLLGGGALFRELFEVGRAVDAPF
jgi:hypothetical protein